MAKQAQGGFTLIEIIIVMAISSMLAAIALMGFSATRGQAQFSDSVERLKESLLTRRTEALSTVKLSGGADAANVTLGKLLTFTPNSSTVTVQTLITANNPAPAAGQAVTVVAAESTTYTVEWGVKYTGGSRIQVAFVRSATDGALQTAVSPNGGWGPPYTYGQFAPNGAVKQLQFKDPDGRTADIVITPTTNGVTRVFP